MSPSICQECPREFTLSPLKRGEGQSRAVNCSGASFKLTPSALRVSVVIPAYNYGRFLAEAIDSAFSQTLPPLEVIVVDDGSTDETAEVLARYGDRLRVFQRQNGGVAAARNFGAAQASGDVLAFLDADDIWVPHKLEMQMARLQRDPDLGMVHCGLEVFDNNGKTEIRLDGLEGHIAPAMLQFEKTRFVATGSTMFISKRIFEELGGFDPRLSPSEDWDLCYRIATRYRIACVREPLVRYRLHGSGIHLNIAGMEKSFLLALDKIFAAGDQAVQPLRRPAYGHVHRILAGCYFERREVRPFVRHLIRSIGYDPRSLLYFLAWPFRVVSRAATRLTR